MDTERAKREWLEKNTFHCAGVRGDISPEQCARNRALEPFGGANTTYYRPPACGRCTDYEEKCTGVERRRAGIKEEIVAKEKTKVKKAGPLVICWECRKITSNFSRGLCGTSYMRAKTRGELDKYPAAGEGGKPNLQPFILARCETECDQFRECQPKEGKTVWPGCIQLQEIMDRQGIEPEEKPSAAPEEKKPVSTEAIRTVRTDKIVIDEHCREVCPLFDICLMLDAYDVPAGCEKIEADAFKAGVFEVVEGDGLPVGESKLKSPEENAGDLIRGIDKVYAYRPTAEENAKVKLIDLSRVEGLQEFLEMWQGEYLHETLEAHILFILKRHMRCNNVLKPVKEGDLL